MIAFVTGSTGFIGAQLCRALVERGYTVRAFHRAKSSLHLLEGLPVEHVVGDLTQSESFAPALQGADVLFHAAALMSGSSTRDLAARMYAVTVEGTRGLYEAALHAGVKRVVHTSSVAALGVPDQVGGTRGSADALMDEHHTWNYQPQRWSYGYSKYLAELEAQKAAAQGLDVVIVNPTFVLGAGDINRQNSSTVVQIARGKVRFVPEGGVNAVHIADVVDGHLAAWERGKTGERYILGGQNLTHAELILRIARAVGVQPPEMVLPGSVLRSLALTLRWLHAYVDLPLEPELLAMAGWYFYFDTRKAQTQLGLAQPRPIDGAIAETVAWFKASGALPE